MTASSMAQTHPVTRGKTSIWQRGLQHNPEQSLASSTQDHPRESGSGTRE